MNMRDTVKITPRFQRSVRLDTDLGNSNSIEGFLCPKSSADMLQAMCKHIKETNQGAFTWTGPYGSGKSSLAVVLSSLLCGNTKCRNAAKKALGGDVSNQILSTLSRDERPWRILPVVGRREDPIHALGDSLENAKLTKAAKRTWTSETLLSEFTRIANDTAHRYGGLLIFIDEMGKFLESAVHDGTDIYFFQQLAEIASRSNKRLLVIGVLHQSFEDYAHRLSREQRDEWSKIQGRFVDLPINVAGEEQIDLLSRAIICTRRPSSARNIASHIADIIHKNKRGTSPKLSAILSNCWPLHPVIACLLGSISRRRFGQNQRSLFGFLNSAEPYAFQDFLERAKTDDFYTLDLLWEYLRTNLEASILASPDGHRWALAVEAIERAESQVSSDLHLSLLKEIALLDLFKGNSGLVASIDILEACHTGCASDEIKEAIAELKRWSYIIYKAHINSFAIYAGSDFDIDDAVLKAREEIRSLDFVGLKRLAGLQPILAKRHYHSTGALRWFDVEIIPLSDVADTAACFVPSSGTVGKFLLAIPTENETRQDAERICEFAADLCNEHDVVIGLSKQSWIVNDLGLEILATEKVYSESAELGGDSVARREVRARLSDLQGQLEVELNRAFDSARWFRKDASAEELSRKSLSVLASDLTDIRYNNSPIIHNELLNRIKPSSNAVAAQNILLRRMVSNEGEHDLGIEGFPAEWGLFSSIIESTGLYNTLSNSFVSPLGTDNDPGNLRPLWESAQNYIEESASRIINISEIYDLWRKRPFGVRDGLLPVLAVAFLLSEKSKLAFYRDGIFQSQIRDIDIEVLCKDPGAIQVRFVNMTDVSKRLLSGMASVVRELDPSNTLRNLDPVDVARGLVSIYVNLPPLTKRTLHLPKEAIKIRSLFSNARDPNKFLFDDIPALLNEDTYPDEESAIERTIELVHLGLRELVSAYPGELSRLKEIMLAELQVPPNISPQALAELRERAINIKKISGDFQLEAFVVRLSDFTGSDVEIEGIASLAIGNKPPRMWSDNDIDRAKLEICVLAQKFIRAESYARVAGREDKRHSLSVVIGLNGRPTPIHHDFDVVDKDRDKIDSLISDISAAIEVSDTSNPNIILAALAELSTRYIDGTSS